MPHMVCRFETQKILKPSCFVFSKQQQNKNKNAPCGMQM